MSVKSAQGARMMRPSLPHRANGHERDDSVRFPIRRYGTLVPFDQTITLYGYEEDRPFSYNISTGGSAAITERRRMTWLHRKHISISVLMNVQR